MNSCNTDIFFSNYHHWQSVRFELSGNSPFACLMAKDSYVKYLAFEPHLSLAFRLKTQMNTNLY